MNGQEIMSRVVKCVVNPIIKKEGFKKYGRNYFREADGIGICFNIQSSMYNSWDRMAFTFNTSIYSREAYIFINKTMPPKLPKEYHGFLNERIGSLKGQLDQWYEINEATVVDILKRQVSDDLENYMLPYMRKFYEMDSAILSIVEGVSRETNIVCIISALVVLLNSGRKEAAKALLSSYLSKAARQEQFEYVREMAEKLGITPS